MSWSLAVFALARVMAPVPESISNSPSLVPCGDGVTDVVPGLVRGCGHAPDGGSRGLGGRQGEGILGLAETRSACGQCRQFRSPQVVVAPGVQPGRQTPAEVVARQAQVLDVQGAQGPGYLPGEIVVPEPEVTQVGEVADRVGQRARELG